MPSLGAAISGMPSGPTSGGGAERCGEYAVAAAADDGDAVEASVDDAGADAAGADAAGANDAGPDATAPPPNTYVLHDSRIRWLCASLPAWTRVVTAC